MVKLTTETKTMETSKPVQKSNKLLLGTLIGGAVGVVSTLLLAPKTGVKMREDLSTKYRDINDKTQKLASNVGEKAQEIAKVVGTQASDIFDKASNLKDKASEVKTTMQEAWRVANEDTKEEIEAAKQSHINKYN